MRFGRTGQVHRATYPYTLGVLRLDKYDYTPARGDVDQPETFEYPVHYCVVRGLTFEMAQRGVMTSEVKEAFERAVRFLCQEVKVSAITGNCGFMMYFQGFARALTPRPIMLSSLAQLPFITCCLSERKKIAILTANGHSLQRMHPLIKRWCAVEPDDERYVIVGCEDVPGFEAIAAGRDVDVAYVEPGMTAKAVKVTEDHPDVAAFLLECTEMPPYGDAIRARTGLPVYDSVTGCNFMMRAVGAGDVELPEEQQSWVRRSVAVKETCCV